MKKNKQKNLRGKKSVKKINLQKKLGQFNQLQVKNWQN